jgi:NAD+ synthase (glutamine-hydrolysing)
VASAFINSTPLDWAGNLRECSMALALARGAGARLALLPELCLSGYGCEDAFLSPNTRLRSLNCLEKLIPQTEGLIAVAGLPIEFEGRLYNTVAVMVDAVLQAVIPKQNLAGNGIHYEPRWFNPWKMGKRAEVPLFGGKVPSGDWIVNCGQALIGFEICHDAWIEDRPCKGLAARGANLILCPSASHFALGKHAKREALVKSAGLPYIYSNLMGNEAGRVIYDGGAMISDGKAIVARGARFSYQGAGVVAADIELRPASAGEGVLEISGFSPSPAADSGVQGPRGKGTMKGEGDSFWEFESAVALGLFDYLRKSKAKGFMLSLSGGADSAASAVLVEHLRQSAIAELGHENFSARLGHAEPLLSCVYQATANSSSATREAARALAQALGAAFYEFEIETLVNQYKCLAETALKRKLDWEHDDLTLQNLQARVRSPGVWALANATGTLLLATNNRSEAAAGYTTMDGDSSGSLAPIAGMGKHFLRQWLKKREPGLPALRAINAFEPTAELRPPAAGQTDEGDLMPYEVLDSIERLASLEGKSPAEVHAAILKLFPGHESSLLGNWVVKFFRLWSRSQWKRERLAPSFHLDEHHVDPRSWRRDPILSGSYEAELAELRAALGL